MYYSEPKFCLCTKYTQMQVALTLLSISSTRVVCFGCKQPSSGTSLTYMKKQHTSWCQFFVYGIDFWDVTVVFCMWVITWDQTVAELTLCKCTDVCVILWTAWRWFCRNETCSRNIGDDTCGTADWTCVDIYLVMARRAAAVSICHRECNYYAN